MAWAAVAGAGVSVLGGLLGKKSSSSAANTQSDAANLASQQYLQYANQAAANNNATFDWSKGLYEPYVQSGNSALNALNYRLGIGGVPTSSYLAGMSSPGYSSTGGLSQAEKDELANLQGLSKTKTTGAFDTYLTQDGKVMDKNQAVEWLRTNMPDDGYDAYRWQAPDVLLNAALNKNVVAHSVGSSTSGGLNSDQQSRLDALLAKQNQPAQPSAYQTAQAQDYSNDPAYGSLLKNFSLADFQASPGYQFRLDEGNKAINHNLASRGMYDSGAALKELDKYNSDQASQEWNNAYSQDATNKSRVFNFLQSVAGMGQGATNALSATGAGYANANANLLTGMGNYTGNATQTAGNAQAAGMVGGANALTSGLSGAFNNYQSANLLSKINNWSPSVSGSGSGSGSGIFNGLSIGGNSVPFTLG